jgi:hypothetical protein
MHNREAKIDGRSTLRLRGRVTILTPPKKYPSMRASHIRRDLPDSATPQPPSKIDKILATGTKKCSNNVNQRRARMQDTESPD